MSSFNRRVKKWFDKANNQPDSRGLTLIETLVASAIFVVFSIAVYRLYATVFSLSTKIRVRTMMTEIAGEQFEFIRNLSYSNVGTVAGIPSGIVPQSTVVTRNGISFSVLTTIRNIDDPADGILGGTPNDLSPADKKLVELSVSCSTCAQPLSIDYTSIVAPKNLETENGNGALIIRAIDANGLAVAGASVHIVNDSTSPQVDITDQTGSDGSLTIVDAPPSNQGYEVTVNKSGYSAEQTYLPGASGNPNPTKPHLTVAANTITQGTFSIDKTATFDVVTQTALCTPVANVVGTLGGTKLIGTSPDVVKHFYDFSTSGGGTDTISGIEWDTYFPELTGSEGTYDIIGTNPVSPLVVVPGSHQTLTLTLAPHSARRLVVAVVDGEGLPLADALVEISGPSGDFDDTTNIGSATQTDWSGGGGQETLSDWSRFFSSSDINFSSGSLRLVQSGTYLPEGTLTSSTIDLGDSPTPHQLSWLPVSQPPAAGSGPVKFQVASSTTNDATTVWNYIGPDGTASTYYTSTPATLSVLHDGKRYLRYKLLLSTEDTSVTPTITDIALTYTSGCLPPGQINIGGLTNGTYHVTVSKSGFQTVEKDITITGDVYEAITLTP